jgi:ABC-type phosphate transport system substrate-binding protein
MMIGNKVLIVIFVLSGLFTGCSAAPVSPTRTLISIQFSAAAQPWLEKANQCSGSSIVNSEQRSSGTQDLSQTDLAIRIGESPDTEGKAYQVGTESIVVIANKQNPVKLLTREQVQGLFGGQIRNWKDVGGRDSDVNVWVFAPGEDLQQLLGQAAMDGSPVTSLAHLAVDPQVMIKAVGADVNALGILTGGLKTADLTVLFTVADEPVLMLTKSEPQGDVLQLITCMQK